jgi:hypothetical protein
MIGAVGLESNAEELDLSFRRPPLADRSGAPVLIGIGDPVTGPLVGLFYDAPSTPEQLAGPPDLAPAHSHPCDNFRIVMKGELWVGRERYHHGEFRLQRSGRPYGTDGDAPHVEGNWRIIMFADRRGHRVRPTNPDLRRAAASPEAIARTKERFGGVLPVVLPDEDDGVDGLVTTIDKPFSKLGHIDASFLEAGSWERVGADGRLAVTLMGVHDSGPVVILQRTPANVAVTPQITIGSDAFRCVIEGAYELGGRVLEMGDTLVRAANRPWEAAMAGPDGVDEVIVIGDRRGAVASVEARHSDWPDTVNAIVARQTTQLRTPARV